MKPEDKLFTELREKELTRDDLFNLSCAIRELSEAISRPVWDAMRHSTNAIRYITEFKGEAIPAPDLTEVEANLARGLHTYMRKCMDTHLGTVLYRLISESRGRNIWYSFVKGLTANKNDFKKAIREAESSYDSGNDTTDDLLMLKALKMWEDEDFQDSINWIKGT